MERKQSVVHVAVMAVSDDVEKKGADLLGGGEIDKTDARYAERKSARILLYRCFTELYGVDPGTLRFTRTSDGKWECDGYYFSISHTHGAVCVAMSDCCVGVDIEGERNVSPSLKDRLCGDGDEEEFFKVWTGKESSYKVSGKGSFSPEQEILPDTAFLTEYYKGKNYYISVSAERSFTVKRWRISEKGRLQRHHEVVGGLFVEDGKVFAARRGGSPYPYVARKYEFVGGKIEPGERAETALLRELKEELALSARVLAPFLRIEHEYPDFSLTLHVFSCAMQSGYVCKEHEALVWIPITALREEEWAPADAPAIALLRSAGSGGTAN